MDQELAEPQREQSPGVDAAVAAVLASAEEAAEGYAATDDMADQISTHMAEHAAEQVTIPHRLILTKSSPNPHLTLT